MKYLFAVLFVASILYPNKGYSQIENFLKLNRIITIDSSKYVNNGSAVVFSVAVPNNVYWKVNYIAFKQDLSCGASSIIKINNSNIGPDGPNTQSSYTSPIILITTPLWIQPNSIIKFETTSVGCNLFKSIYISAEEYMISP